MVREFGIGADWSRLQVPAFSGSVPSATGEANLAAQTIGQGNVRMSLLSMAMVAATVDAGRWHVPQVLQASDPPGAGAALDTGVMTTVRGLMRGAVRSGAAQAASLPGQQVYGQVGMVHTGSGWMSWFVGYRGDIAIAVIETGKTRSFPPPPWPAPFSRPPADPPPCPSAPFGEPAVTLLYIRSGPCDWGARWHSQRIAGHWTGPPTGI